MKHVIIIFTFYFLSLSNLILAQYVNKYQTIKLPDSTEIVFHNTPLVNIEYHDIRVKSVFDYEKTCNSVTNIQETLIEMNYIVPQESDFSSIIENSEFIILLENQEENESQINTFLSGISSEYKERYVCFIAQSGYTTSELLSKAIKEGNLRSNNYANTSGIGVFEHFYITLSGFVLIIFDKNKNDIVYINTCSKSDFDSNDIFSKKINKKQILKLEKILKRQITKNIKNKRSIFENTYKQKKSKWNPTYIEVS